MPALSINVPFPVFQDRDGQPLDNGYVYIGTPYLDPQTNPVQVYFDEALTILAAQPLRTINGYVSNAGTPAQLYVNGVNFSIKVLDSKANLVYSFPDGSGISPNASGVSFTGFKGQVGFVSDIADNDGSDWIGFEQSGTGAVARSSQDKMRDCVSVKDFGAVGDGVTNDTSAIWNAIISLRANPVSILDTVGGSTITAYSSGVVFFPPGIYKISPDQLKIYQDLGLTLKGSGSRRTNNSVRASTTILISGTSSGFGIQVYRNGARGLTIEDMDICYETSAFTGSVFDVFDCPGATMKRVFLGTYGITAGTRLQTAYSCLRSTYDEFMHFVDCVFDGAVRGWWSDDTRTELGNTFGGSFTKFDSCVFYDFSEAHVYHGGSRTRFGVNFSNCAFNPISVSPSSTCLNMDNVDGITVQECGFSPSVSSAPAVQWIRVTNSTGSLVDNFIDDLSSAGQISGQLVVSGNRVFSTNGFTLLGGVITGRSNEFSKGTNGWTISPTYPICIDLGPDLFKANITGRSYDIPVDSVDLAGRINYDAANDSSVLKFRNTSNRVRILNVDGKQFSVSSTPYVVSILDTGRTILATGAANQTFTLPTPTPGTTITITKLSSVDLNVNCAGGTNYYGVGTVAYTGAALAGSSYGTLVLEAYASVGWIVKSQVNSWTFI